MVALPWSIQITCCSRGVLAKRCDVNCSNRLTFTPYFGFLRVSSMRKGVKANVLFFDRKPAQEEPWTQKLWIYDLRTNIHFTLK